VFLFTAKEPEVEQLLEGLDGAPNGQGQPLCYFERSKMHRETAGFEQTGGLRAGQEEAWKIAATGLSQANDLAGVLAKKKRPLSSEEC
jgi:hypothetical protein